MNNRTFYNEVLTEHNLHPAHKHELEDANMTCEGLNPSCGDDIWVHLDVDDNGIIQKGAFEGDGCAISQASADMMFDLIIGKTKAEALRLADLFLKMIKEGHLSDEEMEELEEAASLQDIAHMPARVKCAVLGWHTLKEMLTGEADQANPQPVSTEDK
jgi:nitrogen fixation NifU-like protein